MKQKSLLTTLLLIIGLGSYTVLNTSYSSGFTSYTNNCGCHGGANSATSVVINAPTFYNPGQTYPVTVTVTNAMLNLAGFQVQTSTGTLSTTDPDVTIQSGNMSAGHNKRKSMVGNTATFSLMWTAPTPGGTAATFNAVGNAVNGGGTGGDMWNAAASTNTALPINFKNVSAKQMESHILVQFYTNDEFNVKSFEIEKSIDGVEFSTVTSLTPKGNGLYQYRDHEVTNEAYYYRIKELTNNNEFYYSNVVKTIVTTSNEIAIYPTLIEGNQITISNLAKDKNIELALYDFLGRKVHESRIKNSSHTLPSLNGNFIAVLTENGTVLKVQKLTIQ